MATFSAKNAVQQNNLLSLELHFSDPYAYTYASPPTTLTSSEHLINSRVVFQAKVIRYSEILLYFVKFTKKRASDNLKYAMGYIHKLNNHDNRNQRELCFILGNDCWQLVDEFKLQECTWYITMVLDTCTSVNPCAPLYDDSQLIDLELLGLDGSVYLHKTVAAAFTSVIRTELTEGCGKEAKSVIQGPPYTTEATLLHLKRYMYTDALPDSGLEQLLLAASFYQMSSLEHRCVQELLSDVTPERTHYLLMFAMKHKLSQLVYGIMYRVQDGVLDVDKILNH